MRNAIDVAIGGALRFGARLQPADGQRFPRYDALGIRSRQCRFELLHLTRRHAVGQREGFGGVDGNRFRIALGYDVGQACPLVGLRIRVPRRGKQLAHVVAADGKPLDAFIGAAVVEHEHGAATGGHPRSREHRFDDRIFVVLASAHDPHVDAFAAHECGQHGLKALRQPGVDNLGPLLHGEHRRRMLGFGLLGCGGKRRAECEHENE